jgi:hypothetical protein
MAKLIEEQRLRPPEYHGRKPGDPFPQANAANGQKPIAPRLEPSRNEFAVPYFARLEDRQKFEHDYREQHGESPPYDRPVR